MFFALPALILAFYAQWKVQSTYRRYSREPNARGLSGHEAAHLPGNWRVTVYYDSGRYFNEYFTIVDTTDDEPIPCPLSLIYGDDSLQTRALRNFRDTVLRRTLEGRELIRLYYQWGPAVARAIMADDQFKEEAKELADAVLMMIERIEE